MKNILISLFLFPAFIYKTNAQSDSVNSTIENERQLYIYLNYSRYNFDRVNMNGGSLNVDIDIPVYKKIAFNTGFCIYQLYGRESYPVDSSFITIPYPNGRGDIGLYNKRTRLGALVLPFNAGYKFLVRNNTLAINIGFKVLFAYQYNSRYEYYRKKTYLNPIFDPGPYEGKSDYIGEKGLLIKDILYGISIKYDILKFKKRSLFINSGIYKSAILTKNFEWNIGLGISLK